MKNIPKQKIKQILVEDGKYVYDMMQLTADETKINRSKIGYRALLTYIDDHKIESSLHTLYIGITFMILSAIFGKSGFKEHDIIALCERQYDSKVIYTILEELLTDNNYINILMYS